MREDTVIAKRGILAVFLALALAAPSLAANFQVGWEAYERGDYAMALKEWRPLAEQGDALAQFSLGAMYSVGEGIPQDYAEAVKWYRLAAEQGDASAQNNLGVRYDYGQGVPQDYAEAVKWYRLAAEQRYARAQSNLGLMYAKGKGVPKDYIKAHVWYNLAAARMPPGEDRDREAGNRDNVAKFMTPAQIAEAQRLARKWEPKHLLFRQEDIMLLQWNLKKLGYDPDPVDGITGSQTREAILAFQRDQGLIADGMPSQELSDKAFEELARRLGGKAIIN